MNRMAPLARAHATLRITHHTAAAAEVTERLGLAPTDTHDRGGPRLRNLPPWQHMLWSLSSGPTDTRPLAAHLEALLDLVEPAAKAIHGLASDGFTMDWFCFLDVEGWQGGETLDPALLRRLAELPIDLSLDIYATEALGPTDPPTRLDVESKWSAVVDGRISREAAHDWAEPLMLADYQTQPDTMVMQALQHLHGFDLSQGDDERLVHHGPPGTYVRPPEDIAAELEAWRLRCQEHDADPVGWAARQRQTAEDYRHFDSFAASARAFCGWIESLPGEIGEEQRNKPLTLLSALLAGGYRLPRVEPTVTQPSDVEQSEWTKMFKRLLAWTGSRDTYWTVAAGEQAHAPLAGSIADDLAETWRDLRACLNALDSGSPWQHVAWQARFDLDTHWGKHVSDAIRALQECWARPKVVLPATPSPHGLAEIESRQAAATPGPWRSMVEGRDHLSGDSFLMTGADDDRGPDMYLTWDPAIDEEQRRADQDFIAHARQDIPAMAAEIRRLRDLLDLLPPAAEELKSDNRPAPRRRDGQLVVGDIYEDCQYHPVLCTHVDYDDDVIEGISLIDGSVPRSCCLTHCGVERLSVAEVMRLREPSPDNKSDDDKQGDPYVGA